MRSRSAVSLFMLTLGCCLILIACGKVPLPTSDSTPPALTWRVTNKTANTTREIPPGGNVSANGKDTLLVTLRANDPEGVSFIELGGGYVKSCVVSGGPETVTQGFFGTQLHSLAADAKDQVSMTTIEAITVQADITCNSGYKWDSTAVSLHGLGRNYYLGETTVTLSILFTP